MNFIITSRYKFDSGKFKKQQKGQIIVYVLALLLAASLVMMTVFDTGQLVAQKVKLDATADSVAYSTATAEARGFNYLAYTNRAILANHASMAQLISFFSLARMLQVTFKTTALVFDSIAPELEAIPFVGEVVDAFTTALDVVAGTVQGIVTVIKAIVTAMVEGLYVIDQALWASQTVMVGATVESMVSVYLDVEKANDPNVNADSLAGAISFLSNSGEAASFIKIYPKPSVSTALGMIVDDADTDEDTSDTRVNTLKNVTANYKRWVGVCNLDRDYFTRDREIVPNLAEAIPTVFKPISWLIGVDINGGTNQTQYPDGSYGWNAMDTLSMKVFGSDFSLGAGAIQVGSSDKEPFENSGLGVTMDSLRMQYEADPSGDNADSYSTEMQKYGGLAYFQAIEQYWYSWIPFNVPAAPVSPINNQAFGALVNDPDTAKAAVTGESINASAPYYRGEGIEVIGGNVDLPPSFYDVRNVNQLGQYVFGSDSGAATFDEGSKPIDPSDMLNGNYTPLLAHGWDPRDDLGPAVDVPLQKAAAYLNTTSSIGFGTTSTTTNLTEGSGYNLRAFGKGQVYFKRPMDRWPRSDLTIVHRSLFDPYWNVRLAYPKLWERVADLVGYQ